MLGAFCPRLNLDCDQRQIISSRIDEAKSSDGFDSFRACGFPKMKQLHLCHTNAPLKILIRSVSLSCATGRVRSFELCWEEENKKENNSRIATGVPSSSASAPKAMEDNEAEFLEANRCCHHFYISERP